MSKKTFQILSLIICIVFLIYSFLNYYGINRNLYLKLYSTDSYIEKFSKNPNKPKNRVIISFPLEEKNINSLKPFINSVLDQTIAIQDIAVTSDSETIKKIPKEYSNILTIQAQDQELDKDSANLIFSILREPDRNTKIILVEPHILEEDFVETLLNESENNPEKIIFKNIDSDNYSILIKSNFFDEKILEDKKSNKKQLIEKYSKVQTINL